MVALATALNWLLDRPEEDPGDPVMLCTDSQSALSALRAGPAAQQSRLGATIWQALLTLAERGRRAHLQWVPSHCGLEGNERADTLAKEAARLPQESAPLDVRTVHRAAARSARARVAARWPEGWYRDLMGSRPPPPVTGLDRARAADVHQLRAGHWSASAQYLHRIGRSPGVRCEQCNNHGCPAAQCPICKEEADTPRHVLARCPALMGTRMRVLGSIHPHLMDLRDDDVVAALAAAARSLQSRSATFD
ncbi:Gag-Pol polyprotein [Amphibalanus amphitrite]|uniref:Gag-Pol polyprotein n=1 Tax=Amphibalanus amphitrite TaxID=1232801 RepID=A0A6A4VZQ9_AMPAM|nr:Gag-Pol polyprotein [Amphibalanus amphitrite]KAF0309173.1 Gag-Pol polyprotein [Amphibalanus amphitrite]